MKTIVELITDVIRREGGFVNHPDDKGGPTKYGITQETLSLYLRHAATIEEVENLSEEIARKIYENNYYYGPNIHNLPEQIQTFVFDSSVNHGPSRAIKFVQNVCNQLNYTPELIVDGVIGPNTILGADWTLENKKQLFLKVLIDERRNFYRSIVANDPSQQVFLEGWFNRIDEFERELA